MLGVKETKELNVVTRKEEIMRAYEDLKECLDGIYTINPVFEVSTDTLDVEASMDHWALSLRENMLKAIDDVREIAYKAEKGTYNINSFIKKVINLLNNIDHTYDDCFSEYVKDIFYINLSLTMALSDDDREVIIKDIDKYVVLTVEAERVR